MAARFAPISFGDLAYDVTGSGPTLVLIHGSLLDRTLWNSQLPALASDHQVVRYDARGHGETTSEIVPYAHEHDLLALFEHLRIERATLIGLSMGARIALQFTLSWPDRVDALILCGSGMDNFTYSEAVHACRGAMSEATAAGRQEDAIEAFIDLWVVNPGRRRDEVSRATIDSVRQMARRFMVKPSLAGREMPFDPPIRPRLNTIEVPTLVLVGEHDLPDMLEIAGMLSSTIPGAKQASVHDAGHLANMEQPAHFNELVLDFLAHLGQ